MLTMMSEILICLAFISSIWFVIKNKYTKKFAYKKIVNIWFNTIGVICVLWMMLIGTVAVVYFIPSQVDYKLISSLSYGTGWSTEFSINVMQGMCTSLAIFWIFILIVTIFKIGKINNIKIWHYNKEEEVINKLEKEDRDEKMKKNHPLLYKLNHNKIVDKL